MSHTPSAASKAMHAPSGASGGAASQAAANGGTPAATTSAAASAAAGANKPFSSRLLGMKFMQRARDKEKMQEHVEEQELKDDEAHWTLQSPLGKRRCRVVVGADPWPSGGGRMFFNECSRSGEAAAVEAASMAGAQQAEAGEAAARPRKSEADVSDAAMAEALARREAGPGPGGKRDVNSLDSRVSSFRMQSKRGRR